MVLRLTKTFFNKGKVMKTIEGTNIHLFVNDESMEYELANDGYAGQLTEADTCILRVTTERNDVVGFTVDGKKNVGLKKNMACDLGLYGSAYQQKITVKYGEKTGVWHTEYPQNNIRLLEFGDNGRFRVWEIALVSQDGRFFVTAETTYEAACYRDGFRAVCPEFDKKWPQLVTLLSDLLVDIDIPPFSDYRPVAQTEPAALADNTGRVLWWNSAQGIGMAVVNKDASPNGIARIHWSQLAPRTENCLAYLSPGDHITFTATRSAHQTKMRATTFQCELIGAKFAG